MSKIIIDADGCIFGRLASEVAKRIMLGHEVEIINIEKAAILGKKNDIIERYKAKTLRGHPMSGPFISRSPHLLAKRMIRGMLPKGPRGEGLNRKVSFHIGNPTGKQGEKLKCDVTKSNYWKYTTVGDLTVILGAKKRW
jgi:large subunit ribosomal protein L13